MANKLYEETYIQNIADAIRSKNNSSNTYTISEMADAINSISTGDGIIPTGTKNITSNGTYDVTSYANVEVNVATSSSSSSESLGEHVLSGTFTLSEDTQESQIITHNAGVVPTGILVTVDEMTNPDSLVSKTIGGMVLGRKEAIVFNNTGLVSYAAVVNITDITETSFTIATKAETSYPFAAGLTYRWWVWV